VTRAFVAVRLSPEAINDLVTRTAGLEFRGGRIMTGDQWHLTLQFLGDHADTAGVAAALDGFAVPGGEVRFGAAGAFPSARRGRVLWIGVSEGADLLTRLAAEVGRRMARIGYEGDGRAFFPHVTVARCANPTDLRGPIAALDSMVGAGSWRVDELTVYESELRPEGARYLPRASVLLPG
jgi:RNA 2',3'-cyclic 3'-phosphodiesterase